MKFGTRSQFPVDYQKALFILDWTYGRILAVHLRPRGSTYMGSAEVFLRGQPLNLTDLIGPDGALYFVTGGRKTQSALYRVSYHGPSTQPRGPTQAERNRDQLAHEYRAQRRQAERFHATQGNFEAAPNTPEPRIRQAWRIALEHNPNAQFKSDTYDLEQLTAQANQVTTPSICHSTQIGRTCCLHSSSLTLISFAAHWNAIIGRPNTRKISYPI